MLFVHRGLRCYAAGTAKQGRRRPTGDIASAELQRKGGACHFQSFGRTNVHTTLQAVWPRTPDWEQEDALTLITHHDTAIDAYVPDLSNLVCHLSAMLAISMFKSRTACATLEPGSFDEST